MDVDSGVPPNRETDEFFAHLPGALQSLEDSVEDLVASGWDEPHRRRALDIASSLALRSRTLDLLGIAGPAQAMASILRLRLDAILTLEDELADKLKELMGLMKGLSADSDRRATA